MASKRRARSRGKPTHAKAKAAQRAGNVRRAKKAKKAQVDKRAAENQDKARSGQLKNKRGNQAAGGESTARESGIMASQKANKIKGLEQSVGSLDRRIQNALNKGNTDTAKDLRSRLNKFTTDLGYARAIKGNGVARSSSGNILKTSSGNPIMTSLGRTIFDETKDQDFSDPTRKLQNTGGDAYEKMYPISGAIQKGLPTINAIKSFLGAEDKDIPYNLEDMPGIRYPLDESFGAGDGATFFGGRSKDPNYRQDFFSAPLEEVTISDLVDDKSQPFTNDVVPYIHPAIDPNKRSAIMNEGYEDIIESGRQDFDTLDAEFQKNKSNQELLDKNEDPIDPIKIQELMDLIAAEDAERKAFAEARQNKFYNKDGITVGGEGNLLNTGKEIYNLGGYLSGGQLLNKYALEPAADAILGKNQMVPIDQSKFNPEDIDYSQIRETLKGSQYNLKDDQIEALLNYKPDLLNSSDINSTLSDFYSQ